jgi:gliding motility-associated-like protein
MEDIFVPDAFSPNGDGQNDELFVYGNFITSLELRIFNRWGEEVFMTKDQGNGWDGTFKGKDLTPDVYGYYLRVECPPDKSYFTKGNITLFK